MSRIRLALSAAGVAIGLFSIYRFYAERSGGSLRTSHLPEATFPPPPPAPPKKEEPEQAAPVSTTSVPLPKNEPWDWTMSIEQIVHYKFETYEVHPVALGPDDTVHLLREEALISDDHNTWSVYGRNADGLATCVADRQSKSEAEQIKDLLEKLLLTKPPASEASGD